MGMLLIFYKFQDMAIKVFSATPHGIDAKIVEVEVDCSPGLPGTFIVGLPDPAIRESKERLRGCFRHSATSFFCLRFIRHNHLGLYYLVRAIKIKK